MIAAEGASPDGTGHDAPRPSAPSRRIVAPDTANADPAASRAAAVPAPRPHRHGALLRYY